MRLIKTLSELLDEEIDGIKTYAKLAIDVRDDYPQLAETLFTISKQESEHVNKLHEGVTQVINKYKNTHGEPPKEMLAVYEYLHQKHIDKHAEAKRYQDIYLGK